MTVTLYIALSVVLVELAFLLGYLFTFQICCLFDLLLVAFIRRKLMSRSFMAGLLCGGVGGFSALCTAYVFYRLSEATSVWFLLISLLFPVIGLFKYFRSMLRQVGTGVAETVPIWWRFHAAMMAMPERYRITLEKMYLEKVFPEKVGLIDDPLGHAAYRVTSNYLLKMTLASFLGAAAGLFFAFRLMN